MNNDLKPIHIFAKRFLVGGENAQPDRATNAGHADLYKAFTLAEGNEVAGYVERECPGFTLRRNWTEWPYRIVWTNPKALMTITYTEGDITVVVAPDKESYDKEIAHATAFYKES
jgi:hypothetical protein